MGLHRRSLNVSNGMDARRTAHHPMARRTLRPLEVPAHHKAREEYCEDDERWQRDVHRAAGGSGGLGNYYRLDANRLAFESNFDERASRCRACRGLARALVGQVGAQLHLRGGTGEYRFGQVTLECFHSEVKMSQRRCTQQILGRFDGVSV